MLHLNTFLLDSFEGLFPVCYSFLQNTTKLLLCFQVVYFGDSMHSDIFSAHHYSNWETVLILEELRGDHVMAAGETESEPLEKKGKYEVRVTLYRFQTF